MSDTKFVQDISDHNDGTAGRRQQLRALLLSAADAARQSRQMQVISNRVGRPMSRVVRDVRERVSMLLSAAG
jgi:hypothetical protein